MWKRLMHPNIVPLLGITVKPFHLVSGWMSGGDLQNYIKEHPGADRLGLVGVPLFMLIPCSLHCQLCDIAKGLCYLHFCNVIHGDLKGVCSCSKYCFTTTLTLQQPNVLIDDSGHARIADFGLATVTQNIDSGSASYQHGHTARWTAPEVLEGGIYSKEADVFSFAMVMIEVCHG
jgi:serine/threonine protein kinase